MAKIDQVLDSLQQGYQDPTIQIGNAWVADKDMEALKVRRKKAGEAQHKLFYLSISEKGQSPEMFWGHKMTDVVKKALASKGLPTASKRKKD
jgi:hypothetical protein